MHLKIVDDTSLHINSISFFGFSTKGLPRQFASLRSLSISSHVAHHFPRETETLIHFPPLRQEDLLLSRGDHTRCVSYEEVETVPKTVFRSRRQSNTRCSYENKFPKIIEQITLGFGKVTRKNHSSIYFLFRLYYYDPACVTSILKFFFSEPWND